MKQVYPQDYSCILPPQQDRGGLFIGNLEAAQNKLTLQKHGIKGILTCARGVSLEHPKQFIPYTMQINANDHESYDLSVHFEQAADFIQQTLRKTNLMVHCLAGVSRSVSLVIGWFIKYKGMSFQQAYQFIKNKRRIIHPNDGFIQHLKQYQKKYQGRKRSEPPIASRSRSPSPTYNQSIAHFKTSQMGYQGRTYSPSSIYRTDDRKYQDLIAKHNQSQILIKKDIDRRPVDRYQANYYSPNKKRSIESYSYTKNNLSSEKVTQNIEKYHNASVTKYNNNYSRIHIDTSQIDKKINEIRQKYNQYAKEPNYARYHLEEPRQYSKNTIQKAEDLKNRSYKYINLYESGNFDRPARKANYVYSKY